MGVIDKSSEPDICSICGASVKRQNLRRHYQKAHPKRAQSLGKKKASSESSDLPRAFRPRRVLFLSLLIIAVILVSVAAAQVVSSNTIRMHIHPQLSVSILGATSPVPLNIGIDQTLWKDHSLDKYGAGGRSPLTTHDTSGTIHVESNTARSFTLYEFLSVWGKSIDNTQVVGYNVQSGQSACIVVDGLAMPNLGDVVFTDGQKIILEISSASCSAIS